MIETTTYTVKALDESTWDAFAALVERNNGVFGGCWCMGFHPEGVGKETTAELNRKRKLERVRAGTAHAALVFDGDDCVGWCQFGAPGEVPRIKSRAAYEKALRPRPTGGLRATSSARGTDARVSRPRRSRARSTLSPRLAADGSRATRRAQTPFLPASCSTAPSRPTKGWASPATGRSASTVGSSRRQSNPPGVAELGWRVSRGLDASVTSPAWTRGSTRSVCRGRRSRCCLVPVRR